MTRVRAVVDLWCLSCRKRWFPLGMENSSRMIGRLSQAMEEELVSAARFARARNHAGMTMHVKRDFRFITDHGPRIFQAGRLYSLDPVNNPEDALLVQHDWIKRDMADGAIESFGAGKNGLPISIAQQASEFMGGVPICCIMGEQWWRGNRG